MASAGLVAEGELRLTGGNGDRSFVELCLRRLASLGGGKTRGAGQIRISVEQSQEIAPAAGAAGDPPPQSACRLRLLLCNLEPLCVPATGQPGNIISSETYIPGQTLRGAILTALGDHGATTDETDTLARPELVQFGNAYPVGNATGDGDGHARREFAKWSSIPIPLTALEAKATEQKVDLAHGPWWLPRGQQSELWLANPEVERDGLRDSADNRDEKFKRIKTEEYLVASASGTLQRLRPAMLTLMRNRTPVVRTERVFDSRRPLAEVEDLNAEKGDLFSSHVLAENQLFLTDLRFGSAELASLFWNRAKSLVGGDSKRRTWLRVGRGGCPVRVEAWKWVADVVPQQLPPAADSFTLTLTSDLISRADDLTFHTELDAGTVGRLAGNEVNVQDVSIDRKCSVSETRSVYGFNTAAGTRRSSATAIKRGSAFRVCGSHAALAPLFDALAALVAVGLGLGERQEEGFGRFALNHPAHIRPTKPRAVGTTEPADKHGANGSLDTESRLRRVREDAIGEVLDTVSGEGLKKLCMRKDFPARGQWQQLRHKVEVITAPADLNKLFADLEHMPTISAARCGRAKQPTSCRCGKKSMTFVARAAIFSGSGCSSFTSAVGSLPNWTICAVKRKEPEAWPSIER